MPRLVASDNALAALLLLGQRAGGLRASEVAGALEISYTGASKALGILMTDGLVAVSGHRFQFAGSPRADAAVRFALAFLPTNSALAALARGNAAVEFAGTDEQGAMVVFRRFSEPEAEGRMRCAVEILRQFRPEARVEFIRKEALREQLLDDLAPRRRAQGMRVVAGSVERSFPNRARHRDVDARPLGRLNEAVEVPSARQLSLLSQTHGLRRIVAFGSATRSDFRPDSDIDLLVEPAPGHTLGLGERVEINAEAERLFGRDVDLVVAPVRRASTAERISRDGVVLYDAAR